MSEQQLHPLSDAAQCNLVTESDTANEEDEEMPLELIYRHRADPRAEKGQDALISMMILFKCKCLKVLVLHPVIKPALLHIGYNIRLLLKCWTLSSVHS